VPFTPLHMGPVLTVKAVSPAAVSLVVYGTSQILIDLQPLVVMVSGKGNSHGITHTFIMGIVLGGVASASGKYLAEFFLNLFRKKDQPRVKVSWDVAIFSGVFGGLLHVLMDALVYADIHPLWPFAKGNPLAALGVDDYKMLTFCVLSGLAGLVVYGVVKLLEWLNRHQTSDASKGDRS
jgi:membrane-bound metal-dependent hydrolase YbcI (DUF457 family)